MIMDCVGTKCYYIWCFKNQEIKCFRDKYLTIDQIMLPIEIRNMQIHQHKRTCKKQCQPICRFQLSKITNEK